MTFLFTLASLVWLFVGLAGSTYVTMPLYIDPSNNNWQPLYDAIAANPGLTFNLIINPASGPGDGQYPDAETTGGLAHLNTYPNVRTLGYVHVSWCARSISDVQGDVATYAGWSSNPSTDIHVDGIFFDEAPAEYTDSDHAYMSTASSFVKSTFPSDKNHVSFNPGAPADSRYFDISDSICVFEDQFSTYSDDLTVSSIPADHKPASEFIIYDFNGSPDQQDRIVQSLTGHGIAGVYITTTDGYISFSNLWSDFISSMSDHAGGAPFPDPPSQPSSSSSSSSSALSSSLDPASSSSSSLFPTSTPVNTPIQTLPASPSWFTTMTTLPTPPPSPSPSPSPSSSPWTNHRPHRHHNHGDHRDGFFRYWFHQSHRQSHR